jgi:predicted DNA-binding transcriptional regulator AlpA
MLSSITVDVAARGDRVFLTGPQLQRRLGTSRTGIWRWLNDKALAFPKPTKIRGRNYWALADVEAWERRVTASSK